MKLIGIHGKKHSGKDELCKRLLWFSEVPCKRMAFADCLKAEVAEACDVSLEFIEKHKDNFRLILQGWGSDFRRNLFGTTYWIDKLAFDIGEEKNITPEILIVVPDIRFENEYEFIKKNNGILVHIIRNIPAIDTHESERTINRPFDYIVDNNGDIGFLDVIAKKIIENTYANK